MTSRATCISSSIQSTLHLSHLGIFKSFGRLIHTSLYWKNRPSISKGKIVPPQPLLLRPTHLLLDFGCIFTVPFLDQFCNLPNPVRVRPFSNQRVCFAPLRLPLRFDGEAASRLILGHCPSNTYSKLHDLSQDKKKRSESFLIGPFKVAIYFKLRSRINRQECRSRPLNIRGDRLVAEVDCFISHGHLLQ